MKLTDDMDQKETLIRQSAKEYLDEVFASPEKLTAFLDETSFDKYHSGRRGDYFPMLKSDDYPGGRGRGFIVDPKGACK